MILQKLRRTSDPDLALVEDFETAGYVRHELKHIEIVLLQNDHNQLPHSPGKYAAVDHILFCSEASVAAAQNDLPFLIDKIMPGHLAPGQKNIASKLAGLLEHKRNNRQSEGR